MKEVEYVLPLEKNFFGDILCEKTLSASRRTCFNIPNKKMQLKIC